jgi:tripartite-type tricarboxylate transporter receptor subunit TctC
MTMRLQTNATKPSPAPQVSGALKLTLAAVLAMASGLNALDGAAAQPYPTKSIKIITPISAGSPPDALGRLLGQQLAERLGQSVIIENRPGGGTTIATKAGATAEPDGYTLLYVNAALAYSTVLYPNPGYDPLKSFSPVAVPASWPFFLFVSADVPAGTVQELIAYAKANPGQVNIGFTRGQVPQVAAEMFKAVSGAPFNGVPYRQLPQLTSDLLAGRIHAYFGTGTQDRFSLVQQGRLKALAYTGVTRHPTLPQIPTVTEIGLPQLASIQDWMGIVAPAGTPPEAIRTLNAAINAALACSEVRATFTKLGWDAKIASPQESATFLAAEVKKWAPLVKAAGLEPD